MPKRCIYCLKASNSSKNIPHAFPEALLRDGPVFPVGTICDKCNQYLGNELEAMLVQHPFLSMQIQSYGWPGKKGVRQKLGVFERSRGEKPVLSFPIQPPAIKYNKYGIRTGFTVTPKWNTNFDMTRFSRALHMIAFNLAALNRGIETAFEARYHQVRKYIREPQRGERWPFLQVIAPNGIMKLVPEAYPMALDRGEGEGDFVRIEQFNFVWIVDLMNTGCLWPEGVRVDSDLKISWQVIDENWAPPPDRTDTRADGSRMLYRAVIG